MTWSPQARAAAAKARKTKGTVAKFRAHGEATKTKRMARQMYPGEGRTHAPLDPSRKQAAIAKRGSFTNKPEHQSPITGAGYAAHGVSSSHGSAPKVLPPTGYVAPLQAHVKDNSGVRRPLPPINLAKSSIAKHKPGTRTTASGRSSYKVKKGK